MMSGPLAYGLSSTKGIQTDTHPPTHTHTQQMVKIELVVRPGVNVPGTLGKNCTMHMCVLRLRGANVQSGLFGKMIESTHAGGIRQPRVALTPSRDTVGGGSMLRPFCLPYCTAAGHEQSGEHATPGSRATGHSKTGRGPRSVWPHRPRGALMGLGRNGTTVRWGMGQQRARISAYQGCTRGKVRRLSIVDP